MKIGNKKLWQFIYFAYNFNFISIQTINKLHEYRNIKINKIIKLILKQMNQFFEEAPPHIPIQPQDITKKICQQIEQGKLTISQQKEEFKKKTIQSMSMGELEENRKKMIDRIRLNKQRTQKQLDDLQHQQQELKKALKDISLTKSRIKPKKQRSDFTKQQKQKIKQILQTANQKELNNRNMHENIMKSFTNFLKDEQLKKQQFVDKLRFDHRRQVQHNLLNIQLRKKLRDQSIKEMSKKMQEVRKRKYLHLMKQKQDEEVKKQEQSFYYQKIEEIKSRFRLDFNEIKDHQQKYRKNAELRNLERSQRYKTENSSYSTTRKFSKGLFSRILEQEQIEKNIQKSRKESRPKEVRWKIDQFKELVKKKYMPRLNSQQKSGSLSPSSLEKKNRKQAQSLSHHERFERGNEYLKQAKKLTKKKQESLVSDQPITKYVDYLKQMRRKSNKSGTFKQFKSIIDSDTSIDFGSAQKAQMLMETIEAKSKKTKDQKLLETIQNKLDLLKVLI